MTKYIGQLQAKVYRLDAVMLQAKRDKNWAAYEVAEIELDETLYTVGPGSFIHPLIELAGGQNIAADADNPYPQFSAEQIIAKDPEVIILADAAYGVTPEQVKARPGWDQITAVQNGAVYPIDGDIISRPGPRILDGLKALASLIHPELME